MKTLGRVAGIAVLAIAFAPHASAQAPAPVVVPISGDPGVPMGVRAGKAKPRAGTVKFEGFVINANIAQITVRAKGEDQSIQTFALSEAVSAKMQQIIDKGGYQFGDKVTIYYDPS